MFSFNFLAKDTKMAKSLCYSAIIGDSCFKEKSEGGGDTPLSDGGCRWQ